MRTTCKSIDLGDLVWFVRSKYGVDLTRYRQSCLARRVALRMTTLGSKELGEYILHIDSHPQEVDQLLDIVTIHVTEFFRDQECFELLREKIFPMLIGNNAGTGKRTFQVWSAGCSTGEETYSIAVLLVDFLRKSGFDGSIRVLGTDISERACRSARKGIYPESKVERVPSRLKRRYFEVTDEGYLVTRDVKRYVSFRVHDLFSKPLFSAVDLILCRNVLIHFNNEVRSEVLSNFYSALDDCAVLILGKSEAVTGPELEWFELIDPRNKIYRKRWESRAQGGE